ncbi:MAG TPA: hypothetical protein VFH01_07430, partial [Pyrinomonadaceae bacterium]|nr:hypothetical protein [Pyrinomonadaceae bacterium]
MKSWASLLRVTVTLAIALSFISAPVATPSTTFTATAASRDPVRARHGIVASTSRIASQVGVDIMRR